MADEKSRSEYREDFVKHMLKKSQEEDKQPAPNNADVDPDKVEQLLKKIQKDIQEKK